MMLVHEVRSRLLWDWWDYGNERQRVWLAIVP